MAFDSRPRPVRRPARRRVHLLTALTLLVMAAGVWFADAATTPVPTPRLQVAEARVAAAENAIAEEPAPAEPAAARPVIPAAAPVGSGPVAAARAATPAVAGPRAPPHG